MHPAGFIGVGLLVLSADAGLDGVGIVAAIGGSIAMAIGTVLVQRWLPPVSLLAFAAWQLTVGGAILLPVALIIESPLVEISTTNLLGLIYLSLISSGVAYFLWFRGITKLQASAASYLGLLTPVVASIVGFVFLKQTFNPTQIFGMTLIVMSVLVGQQNINNTYRSKRNLKSRS